MPRGKRKTALEAITEQLKQKDIQIQEAKDKLKVLEDDRKALLEQKKKQELDALYQKIQESGKTVEEIFETLQRQ